MEKNKKFENPELTIIYFTNDDIITGSGENYVPYDSDKDYWLDE